MTKSDLIKLATEARERAYAPYSNYQVGAALLTGAGDVFTGCNVENASYGLTLCAERTAVGNAVSAGHRTFSMMAISLPGAASPCGACRQVLHEFSPDLCLLMADEHGNLIEEMKMDALLPRAFGPEH